MSEAPETPALPVSIQSEGERAPDARANLRALVDIAPKVFPDGLTIVVMRPKDLEPAATLQLERGCMVFFADPESATHLRPMPDGALAGMRLLLDLHPEKFPDGAELVFMKPGALESAGTIPIVSGCILYTCPPEPAANLRRQMQATINKRRELARRNGVRV